MISSRVINDANGNPIFKIVNDKTASNLFWSAISENSTLPSADYEDEDTDINDTSNSTISDTASTEQDARLYHSKTSSGLSGGAIVGIIIICLVRFIAVGVLTSLIKKGILVITAVTATIDDSTTISRLYYVWREKINNWSIAH